MPRPIPEFTAREKNLVARTLAERFDQPITVQPTRSEIQLNLLEEVLTECPSLTWKVGVCTFVVFKTGDQRFRCQFYYTDVEQFGTNEREYDNLGDCVVTLLQLQGKHEDERKRLLRGINAVDFSKANDGEEYHAPIIV